MKAETTMGKLDFNNKKEKCNKRNKNRKEICVHT